MHDQYTVFSTGGDEQQHTRLVIAADKRDAIKTHREHFPGCKVTGVIGSTSNCATSTPVAMLTSSRANSAS